MKELKPAILMSLFFMLLTGIIFPIIIWITAQIAFPFQANGSFIKDKNGAIVGSELIGQNFSSNKYFHPRPSAAGNGYDAVSSSGTNLGPISTKLISGVHDDPSTSEIDETFLGVKDLARLYREKNMLGEGSIIPADAVTRSASGLDPHISPKNAMLQANRIANSRGLPLSQIISEIELNTEPRLFGLFGEPRVNVLKLNLALDDRS